MHEIFLKHANAILWPGVTMSPAKTAKLLLGFVILVFVAALTASALSGVSNPTSYSVPDRGAATYSSLGTGSLTAGYGRVQPNTGSTTPAGYLTFSYRTNGVLVSEASVPISSPITSGRIYSLVTGSTTTGVAIVNPNSTAATISFYFTDSSGQNFHNSSFVLPPNQQIAKFVYEAPFMCCGFGGAMTGTMTFSSDAPVGVIALLGFTNQRGEFLMTTLPVTDPTVAPSSDVLFFPHYASGFSSGGLWNTEIILVNPTDTNLAGC